MPPTPRWVTDAHRRISTDLLAAVRTEFPHGPVDDYTRAALADHVTAAGMLDDSSTDPAFLACDPPSLLRLRPEATTSQAHSALAAYELSLGHHDRDAGLWWLHVWARKTRCHRLADRAVQWLGRSWTVTAGMWSGTSHRSLTGHTGLVRAVCAVPLAEGPTLVASASYDDTVRLWDPATGQQIGEPLTGHTGRVSGVCAVSLAEGPTLLASASHDRAVLVWKPPADLQD